MNDAKRRHPLQPAPRRQDEEAARERLDVLDVEGNPTGETKARAEVHRDGDWHRVFHLWIAGEGDTVLVQRRAPYKDLAAGRLDVTVGGHLRAGESWPSGLREVEEELGLALEIQDLERLGTFTSERAYPGAVDREVQEVFAVRREAPLGAYHLDPGEVDVLYEVPIARAIELWRDGRHVPAPGWDSQRRVANALLHEGDLIEQGRDATVAALLVLAEWLGADVPEGAEP